MLAGVARACGLGGRRRESGWRGSWRSKGDFARFAAQLFLRRFSPGRKYEFCRQAVSGVSSTALRFWVAFSRIRASLRGRILLRALDPFWRATLFLLDGRIFYGIVRDLISMAISAKFSNRRYGGSVAARGGEGRRTASVAMGTSSGLRPMSIALLPHHDAR